MTYPQENGHLFINSNNINESTDEVIGINKGKEIQNKTLIMDGVKQASVKAAWATIYIVTSGLARKAILGGLLYLAGGVIVSTIGLGPVVAISSVIWLL